MGVIQRGWRVVSNVGTAVWLYQIAPSGLVAVITGIWAAVSGLPPILIFLSSTAAFALALVILTHLPRLLQQWREKKSPIRVVSTIAADCEPLVTRFGKSIPNGYSVALKILAFNGRADGATLRNLEARAYSISGEWVTLPIRKAENGIVNLRHGERAEIELGRVMFRVGEGVLPALFRGGGTTQEADPEEFRCNAIPKPAGEYAILKLGDALGPSRTGLANRIGGSFDAVSVIISSDDVLSRRLRLSVAIDPSTKPESWVTFLGGAEKA